MSRKQWLPEGFIRVWKTSEDKYSKEFGMPTDLIYNVKEGIIYYYFNDSRGRSMCPYVGKNGKACTIKDMEIVEVD